MIPVPDHPEKIPDYELQQRSHTNAQKFKP